jgi:hypothetical protein
LAGRIAGWVHVALYLAILGMIAKRHRDDDPERRG